MTFISSARSRLPIRRFSMIASGRVEELGERAGPLREPEVGHDDDVLRCLWMK